MRKVRSAEANAGSAAGSVAAGAISWITNRCSTGAPNGWSSVSTTSRRLRPGGCQANVQLIPEPLATCTGCSTVGGPW